MTGNSRRNRVLRNNLSGNGYVRTASPPNFGLGLIAAIDNLIEDNVVTGNVTGIRIQSVSTGNVLRGNIVAGNPPIWVSNNSPENANFSFDIMNQSAAGVNKFENNTCITATNAPCANVRLQADIAPVAAGILIDTPRSRRGGSVIATFSGSNLTSTTYFDVRFRTPGSSSDDVALNWQQGPVSPHAIPQSTIVGDWTITGVRAHLDADDHSGPFVPVNAIVSVFVSPF